MSQEQLAAEAMMSRSHLSAIEAPNIVRPFSVEVLFNIADALKVEPGDLLNASIIPEHILNKKENEVAMDSEPIATWFFSFWSYFAHSELRHGLFCDWFSGVIKVS